MTITEMIYTATTWGIPLVLAVVIHEVAHGLVAYFLGDATAKDDNRLTLNPLAHVDWVGSVFLPATLLFMSAPFLIGWAKPVPIDYGNFKKPNRDMALVALAGPVSNILLAILFVLVGKHIGSVFEVAGPSYQWVMENVHNGVVFSLMLAIFNMIPILPLDGGKILLCLLPVEYARKYQRLEPFGGLMIMVLLFSPMLLGINVLGWIFGTFFPYLYYLIEKITL